MIFVALNTAARPLCAGRPVVRAAPLNWAAHRYQKSLRQKSEFRIEPASRGGGGSSGDPVLMGRHEPRADE